ncbi:unnamed protein product [Rotaria sp. Silwood1]|nr:unnamed protein product [Rotaria sp. Silwood1]
MQINDQQPTNDYLKLLADLLTSQLTSLSGMMQQTDKYRKLYLKKSKLSSSSTASISTLMITQTQIQTSTIIILSPTASIDYYCYHSLVIQLSKYLIENKNLSNKLFILISKSLSDINQIVRNYIESNSALNTGILCYEPIDFEEFHKQIKIDLNLKIAFKKLMHCLNYQYFTFTLRSRKGAFTSNHLLKISSQSNKTKKLKPKEKPSTSILTSDSNTISTKKLPKKLKLQTPTISLKEIVRNYIESNSALHTGILCYEPIDFEEFHKQIKTDLNLKIAFKKLMHCLNYQYFTFTLRSRKGAFTSVMRAKRRHK